MRNGMMLLMVVLLLVSVSPVFSASLEGGEGPGGLGASLPLWSVIPFVGILLSIAVFPLVAENFWHHHFGKVSAFWSLLLAVPFVFAYGGEAIHEILHTYLLEFFPFIILLWALYTVAGGILMRGAPAGTPVNNCIILALGTALASWIGTTGAAMLFIRPYIRMNAFRKSKVHLMIFFIFLIANIGGALTPLGDPPLFLGFLQGVEFFWTLKLFPAMIFTVAILFVIFFVWDTYMFRKEGWHNRMHELSHHAELHDVTDLEKEELVNEEEMAVDDPKTHKTVTKTYTLTFKGLFNFIFLAGIVAGVLFSGKFHLGEVTVFGIHMEWQNIGRDFWLIGMGLLSLKLTPKAFRDENEFSWFPILEVGKLFAGIFITIIPALAMLRAGQDGHLKFIINAVEEPVHYFWITGALSSFLDNAPTYLVFFNTALGKFSETVTWLMQDGGVYLLAISCGAVFFGACTYIGNAPNFMVKSIAEQSGVKMPSFFGYMGYSIIILIPVFVLVSIIFF